MTFIGRDPQQPTRTLRFMQIMQRIVNGLLRTGAVTQGSNGEYELVVTTEDSILAARVLALKSSYGMWGG
jgi:hypothetical protein